MKINIKGYIENSDLNEKTTIDVIGIKKDNIITYNEYDTKVKLTTEKNKLTITRESEEFIMNLILEKDRQTHGKYYIKEIDKKATLNLITEELEINDSKITVIYKMDNSEVKYEIEYKEVI